MRIKKDKTPKADHSIPEFLEKVEGKDYLASNKGRLTNEEIMEHNLQFVCTTGSVWNYKFIV